MDARMEQNIVHIVISHAAQKLLLEQKRFDRALFARIYVDESIPVNTQNIRAQFIKRRMRFARCNGMKAAEPPEIYGQMKGTGREE